MNYKVDDLQNTKKVKNPTGLENLSGCNTINKLIMNDLLDNSCLLMYLVMLIGIKI